MNKNTTLSFMGNHRFSFIPTSMYLWSTADEIFCSSFCCTAIIYTNSLIRFLSPSYGNLKAVSYNFIRVGVILRKRMKKLNIHSTGILSQDGLFFNCPMEFLLISLNSQLRLL